MDPNTNQTKGDENDLSTDNPQTQQSGVSMLTTSLNQSASASTLRVQPTMRRMHSSPPSNNEEMFQSFGNFINAEASEGDTHHYQSLVNAAAEEDPDRKPKRQSRPTRLQFSPSTRTGTIRNASYSGEPVPWSALRHYSDGSLVTSPIQVNTSHDGVYSPGGITSESGNYPPQLPMSLDDGRSLFSVIMDDGTRQRRKISLSSDHSNQTPRHSVSESVPLLGSGYDSDSEYEEDQDAEPLESPFSYYMYSVKSWIHDKLQLSQQQKNIIKCAIAYFIASMFTFVPSLNSLAGLTDAQNSHLVATVAVFFNPAKTIGGICEAVMFAILAGLYGVFISVASMTSAVWFNTHELYIVGHLVGVIVWCGGSMFIVAFMKATLNKPTFNSACSLANIIIFIVLTREGSVQLGVFSVDKIIQVATIVLVGISISFLVSISIWPISASEKLKTDIGKTLESFRLLLKLLTKTFLIDDINYNDESVQSAIASHRATFTSLEASFGQARLEIHNRTMQRELPIYREVIKGLQRLAQHLGGLRSCCGLQWEMIKDKDKNGEIPLQEGESQRRPSGNFAEEEEYGDFNVLLEFIHHVGPHMKSLAYTCKQTMIHLQDQFVKPRSATSSGPSFHLLRQNLNNALSLFETSQTRAVTGLYKKQSNNGHFDGRPNEEVFLIYFFVFNLQEFTRELERLVGLVGGINELEAKDEEWRSKLEWWRLRRWLCCWPFNDADDDKILEFTKDIGASSKYDSKVEFPEHSHNLFDTIQTPKPKTKWQRFTMKLWRWFSRFRRFEVKYAFKAAVSAAILASPAFIDYTRPTFVKYRGEWACISMMVVMVPTVGGTNLMGIYRVLGTLFGSWLAFTIYYVFPDNGFVLSIIGFFVSLVCFHILLYTKFNRMGQFILLTYNLVALYKFNLRNDEEEDLDLLHIALYRGIAVATGVFWGVFVTSYWWPYEARTELRKSLSLLIINISWLYKKLVGLYSVPPTNDEPTATTSNQARQNGEVTAVTITQSAHHHLSRSTKEFLELELFLQVSILKLYDLLAQTPNEPRLKGPFPVAAYSKILTGCQNILDKMLSMRIAVTKEQFYDAIRRDFIIPINRERHELIGNMLLYFYVLAAALRLKTPLPPYLPPAEQARKRMVKKIRDLPVVRRRIVEGDDEHYIVYYAYALVMEDIIRELEHLGAIMQELFGTMGGEDFEDFHESDQNAVNQDNPEAPN